MPIAEVFDPYRYKQLFQIGYQAALESGIIDSLIQFHYDSLVDCSNSPEEIPYTLTYYQSKYVYYDTRYFKNVFTGEIT